MPLSASNRVNTNETTIFTHSLPMFPESVQGTNLRSSKHA